MPHRILERYPWRQMILVPSSIATLMLGVACSSSGSEQKSVTTQTRGISDNAHAPRATPAPVPSTDASALSDDRADLTLFMPVVYDEQILEQARRLEVSPSVVLSAAWIAARGQIEKSSVQPALTTGESARVYFYVSRRIQQQGVGLAQRLKRSRSWVFLKAWEMKKAEIAAIQRQSDLFAWTRTKRRTESNN